MSLSNKNLKRAMYTFVDGPNLGEILIVVDYSDTTVDTLILYNGGNRRKSISRFFFNIMIQRNELEFVQTLPKDVFKNIQNTWKLLVDEP